MGRVCHVPRESESGFMVLLFCLGETKSSLEPLIKVNIPVFLYFKANVKCYGFVIFGLLFSYKPFFFLFIVYCVDICDKYRSTRIFAIFLTLEE